MGGGRRIKLSASIKAGLTLKAAAVMEKKRLL
jgi:hypothetical protein